MFNKKMKLFLMTLVFMLSISAVSAVADNASDDMGIGDVDEEPPSGDVQSVSLSETKTSNGALLNAVNNENASQNDCLSASSSNPTLTGKDVNMYYKNGSSYVVTLLDNGKAVKNATIKIVINDKVYNRVTNSYGKATLNLGLAAGNHTVTASYGKVSVSNKINVLPVILGNDVVKTYGSSTAYVVKLLDNHGKALANTYVNFTLNGKKYSIKTNDYGIAKLPLNLDVGSYSVSAIHPNGFKINEKITVKTSIVSSYFAKHYNSSNNFKATFYDKQGNPLANSNVKFSLNGKMFSVKTNSKGVAVLPITLGVGSYKVTSINPVTGQQKNNTVVVWTSVVSNDLTKRYKSSRCFNVTFYGLDDKVYANKDVSFVVGGNSYTVKTNANGLAVFPINLGVGACKITSINPATGEKVVNKITVRPTLVVKQNVTTFTDKTYNLKIYLYKNEILAKNANVYITVNGVKYTNKTDANGLAHYVFKLPKGKHVFKIEDPYTGYYLGVTVYVKSPTIKASNMEATVNEYSTYKITLLNQDGSVCPYKNVIISIDGNDKTVKTDSKGVASVQFKLSSGTYYVKCTDLTTGYAVTKKITVTAAKKYNKYGVSSDGKTILAIGRASASGELSKYGYTFYVTEFVRTCPCCGGHNLYWGIFWAGSETANYGVFPATGNKEGSSAEGAIFCADCDSDWSVFGHNHGGSGGDLTVVTKTTASSKADAYKLKNGDYVKS